MASEKQRNKANSKQKMSKVNSTWTSTNRCSSKSATKDLNDLNRTTENQEAELRRKNQAEKNQAEQQLKDLDSQKRNVESLRRTEDKHTASIQKDLKLKEKQKQAEQNQINSHSNAMLFNSDCIQETDKTLQQNAEKLEILRKLENTRKDIQSSFSLHRIHQTQRTGVYNGNHNEEDFHDIETIHEEGGYGADVLSNECLQLLDDIVSQHSKDMQVSKKLASLTQQMVTIISDSDDWQILAKIIKEQRADLQLLIKSLQQIIVNYPLVKLLKSAKKSQLVKSFLIEMNKKAGQNSSMKIDRDAQTNVLMALHEFHAQNWSFEEIQQIFKNEVVKEGDAAALGLRDLLCQKHLEILLAIVQKSFSTPIDVKTFENRLNSILNYSIELNPSTLVGDFFVPVVNSLKKHKIKSPSELQELLNQFIKSKINLNSPEQCLLKEPLDQKQVIFVLEQVYMNLDQLTVMLRDCLELRKRNGRSEKNEFVNLISELIFDRLFVEEYGIHLWKGFELTIEQEIKVQGKGKAPLKSDFELNKCFLSYPERAKVFKSLKDKVLTLIYQQEGKKNFPKELMIGDFDVPEFLLNFKNIKKTRNQMTKREEFSKKLKKAIFSFDQLQWTLSDLKQLHTIFDDDEINKIFSDESLNLLWVHLKAEHQKTARNYFYNWVEKSDKEIEKLRNDVDNHKTHLKSIQEEFVKNNTRKIAEPTQEIQEMNNLLEKLDYIATIVSPPEGISNLWKTISEVTGSNLKIQLKQRINELLKSSRVMSQQIAAPQLSDAWERFKRDPGTFANFIALVDLILQSLKEGTELMRKDWIHSFVEDLQMIVQCQASWTTEDMKPLEECLPRWKNLLSNLKDVPQTLSEGLGKLTNFLVLALFRDTQIIEEIQLKRNLKLQELLRSNRRLFSSVAQLAANLEEIGGESSDSLFLAISFLDTEEKEVSLNSDMVESKLKFIFNSESDILQGAFQWAYPKQFKEDLINGNWTLITCLLTRSQGRDKLMMKIASELCIHLTSPNFDTMKKWTHLLAPFLKSEIVADEIKMLHSTLIKILDQYYRKKYQGQEDINQAYSHSFGYLNIIAKFLGKNQVEVTFLILQGMFFLRNLDPESGTNSQIKTFLFEAGKTKWIGADAQVILENICCSDENSTFQPLLLRWIQSTNVSNTKNVCHMSKLLLQKDSKEIVRYLSGVGMSLLTNEEMKYVRIIGFEKSEKLLYNESPVMYQLRLKECALKTIYNLFFSLENELKESAENDHTPIDSKSHIEIEKDKIVQNFKKQFDRAHFFAKHNSMEYEWLIWLKEIVIKSLISSSLSITKLSKFLYYTADASLLEEVIPLTLKTRPKQWLASLFMKSITDFFNNQGYKADILQLEDDLLAFLTNCQSVGETIVELLYLKLRDEADLKQDSSRLQDFAQMISSLRLLNSKADVKQFQTMPLSRWPLLIRQEWLAKDWSVGLANQITKLDSCLGSETTDLFIANFCKYMKTTKMDKENSMKKILHNLSKYKWIKEHFLALSCKSDPKIWTLILSEDLILEEMNQKRDKELNTKEIISEMKNDPKCRSIHSLLDSNLEKKIDEIKEKRFDYTKWNKYDVMRWARNVRAKPEIAMDIVEYLLVACQAVFLIKKFYPRDIQLLAILGSHFSQICLRSTKLSTLLHEKLAQL